MKGLIIRCTKMVLVLDEDELLKNLPPGILEQAIRRGKGYRRYESMVKRSTKDIYRKAGDLR